MQFVFIPERVCSNMYMIEVDEKSRIITRFDFKGGCPGNLLGISRIVIGMKAEDVIERFRGTRCGFKSTSCPDQLSYAREEALAAAAKYILCFEWLLSLPWTGVFCISRKNPAPLW